MKILKATIYGFGKWVDVTFKFMENENNFICFYGENESGKTTLQQFILYILFGLPPKERQAMKPKQGNKFGGKLALLDDKIGQFTIERIDHNVRCFLNDGIEKDEQWLRQHFEHTTRKMMTDIYSFSAIDLEEIRRFNEEELTEVLFSIGLSGVTDIYDTEKKLKTKTAELFRPQGKVRDINIKLTELTEAHNNLQNYLEKEATYIALKEQQQSINYQLEQNKTLENKQKANLRTLQQIAQLLPQIKEYEQNKEKYEELPKKLSFPEDGLDRYEKLKQALLPLKANLNNLQTNEKSLKSQFEAIGHQLYSLEIYEEIKLILMKKQTYEQLNMSIEQRHQQIEGLNTEINDEAQKIGIKPETIEQYTFPYQLESDWKEFAESKQMLTLNQQNLQQRKTKLTLDQQQIDDDIEKIRIKQLDEQEILELNEKLNQHQLASQHKMIENKNNEHIQQTIKKQNRMSSMIFGSTFIILIGLIFFAFTSASHTWKLIILTLLIVHSIAWIGSRKYLKSFKNMTEQNDEQHSLLFNEDEYDDLQKQLQNQNDLKVVIRALKSEQNKLKNSEQILKEDLEKFTCELSQWEKNKKEIVRQYPFLQHVKVGSWIDLYKIIQKIKQLQTKKSNLIKQKSDFQNKSHSIDKEIQQLSDDLEWEYNRLTFSDLDKIMIDYYKNNEMKNEYEEQIIKNKNEQQLVNEKIRIIEEEIVKLFSISQVKNEEEFYKVNQLLIEQTALEKELKKFNIQLENTFSPTLKEKVISQGWDVSRIQLEITTVENKLAELEEEQDGLNRQLATTQYEILEIESSEQFSQAAFYFQMKRDELNELAEQWAIFQVALSSLQNAKKLYQDKHISTIMKETTKYFRKMTDGSYVHVYPPVDKQSFQVEARDGTRYLIAELSQGTVNQLYVALRLAIGMVMSENIAFPFIIDDAFVHFDSIRTSHMIDILKEISARTQVILFTCKKDIAEICTPTNIMPEIETLAIELN